MTSARRARRPRLAPTRVRAQMLELQVQLGRATGVLHDQLELEIATAAPIGVVLVLAPPCCECGRWNYHLAACSRGQAA